MATKKTDSVDQISAIHLASDIVAAYVGNNSVKADELPNLLHDVYSAVNGLAEEGAAFVANREPAVPINKSVTPDFIICLEDGKKLKMLKRYLRTHYNLSPEEYRRKWGLPADYPMTAPNYAKSRSRLAKDIGLGTTATSKKRKTAKRKTSRKKA
ncbi:MucR family transcriptional regulator [Hyphococcus luteus]|uniref:Transcriptional regulator n=1 Tax=Hyphococcus luteus TaxID=2058213 RepID=A0A2S7K0V9_9PROT|nr:MucR family transcriptional regulator [Marinicaulis flavus]PQA86106.1 transcriptional regulator [Marinicaulis flavus]